MGSVSLSALLGGAAIAALLPSGAALAQTAASAAAPAAIAEVVVTASKRQELLSKTPLALTVVSSAALEQRGITNVEGLTTSIPNTQLFYVATGGVQLSIRGINTNQNNELGNPSVAFHVNGVYEPRPEGINALLYDVERIEVLRGPQGTLYGRNSAAGSINVITAAPTHVTGGSADISYGNYKDVTARGVLNASPSDTLAVRTALFYEKNDGYFKSTPSGNYGKIDALGARLTALWTPTEAFSWQIEGDYYRNKGVCKVEPLQRL